jgi:NAD(P)-dependent dehydrogenase (short-subunit alcohol dehydrogenase family)
VLRSYVVTGAGRGVGRAIAERLMASGDAVVALDRDGAALDWMAGHPAGHRAIALAGDAADAAVTERAADLAHDAGSLVGWVNNAAIFSDAWLDAVPAAEVVELIKANLALAVTGCATAVRRFLAAGSGGAIVRSCPSTAGGQSSAWILSRPDREVPGSSAKHLVRRIALRRRCRMSRRSAPC